MRKNTKCFLIPVIVSSKKNHEWIKARCFSYEQNVGNSNAFPDWKYVFRSKTKNKYRRNPSNQYSRWMPGNPRNTRPSISWLCSETNSKFRVHRQMRLLFTGKKKHSFHKINLLTGISRRFLAAKFGKWNDPVCVVKNRAREKLRCLCSVRKRSPAKGNLKR